MKEIEFGEEQLSQLHDIAAALFADPEDPSSYGYKRELIRPQIRWGRIVLQCLFPLLIAFGLSWLLVWLGLKPAAAGGISLAALGIYLLLRLKAVLICMVRIYQRYAPASVREKCRFEPSCSQYMILALEKYGLWKGLSMGIRRLRRCNIHHGGYDYP